MFNIPSLNIRHPKSPTPPLIELEGPRTNFPRSRYACMDISTQPRLQVFIYIGEKAKIHKSCPVGINPQWRWQRPLFHRYVYAPIFPARKIKPNQSDGTKKREGGGVSYQTSHRRKRQGQQNNSTPPWNRRRNSTGVLSRAGNRPIGKSRPASHIDHLRGSRQGPYQRLLVLLRGRLIEDLHRLSQTSRTAGLVAAGQRYPQGKIVRIIVRG